MANRRRIVKLHGLGTHRDMFGYGSGAAYDDMSIFIGPGEFPVSEDGVKYTGLVFDMFPDGGLPEIMSEKCDLFSPVSKFGSASFRVQLDDYYPTSQIAGYPHSSISEQVRRFLNVGKVKPWAFFRVTATTGELDVDSWPAHTATDFIYVKKRPFKPDPVVGQTLFWGREALLVTEVASLTPGDISEFPDANFAFKAIKRCFGTNHERHGSSRSPINDIEIFTENHIVLSREITIYDYDVATGVLHYRWSGFIKAPGSSANHGIVEIEAQGQEGLANRQKPMNKRAFWAPNANDDTGASYSPHKRIYPLKPFKVNESNINFVVCKQDTSVILAQYEEENVSSDGTRTYTIAPFKGAIMGTIFDRNKSLIARDLGSAEEILTGSDDWNHFKFDFGSGLEYSTHPFDVVRALWCSNLGVDANVYDVLPHGVGLGIPYDRVNHEEIDALKNGEYGGVSWLYKNLTMRSLIIGEDKLEDVWTIIDRFLAPIFCTATKDGEGRHTIRSLLGKGPDYVVADYQPDDFQKNGTKYESTRYDPVKEIIAKVARRGCGGKYSGEIRASDVRGSIENRFSGLAEDEELSCLDYGRPGVVPTNWMSIPELMSLSYFISIRHEIRNSNIHFYGLSAVGSGDGLVIGDEITVTHPVLMGNDGDRGLDARRLMILGIDLPSHAAGEIHTLDLVDVEAFNDPARTVAPSWVVQSVSIQGGNHRIAVKSSVNGVAADSTLSFLRVGMKLILLNEKGVRYNAEFKTVHSIVTPLTEYSQFRVTGLFTTTPSEWDIITLAEYDDSDSDETNRYAWVAEDDATVDASETEGPLWGF